MRIKMLQTVSTVEQVLLYDKFYDIQETLARALIKSGQAEDPFAVKEPEPPKPAPEKPEIVKEAAPEPKAKKAAAKKKAARKPAKKKAAKKPAKKKAAGKKAKK